MTPVVPADPLAPFHSRLPFGMPDFEAVADPAVFSPAFVEARRRHSAEIQAIVDNPSPPDFDNTLVALEKAGHDLARVATILDIYGTAESSPEIKAIQEHEAPLNAAHMDDITLNPHLWARVHEVHETQRGVPDEPEARRLLKVAHDSFVRAGALLDAAAKERIKAINQEDAGLKVALHRCILDGRVAATMVGSDPAELEGLSEESKEAAHTAAAEMGLSHGWALPLVNCTVQPLQAELMRPEVRQRLLDASLSRNSTGGVNDTREALVRLAALRAERAQILGHASHAHFVLDDQMSKTPGRMKGLIEQMARPSIERARAEYAHMESVLGQPVTAADRPWAAAEVRRREHDIDEQAIVPYFEFNRVLEGAFYTAQVLYGLSFIPRPDLKGYNPEVRMYEVQDEHGKAVGIYNVDPFSRPEKDGGAWMNLWVAQDKVACTLPVVTNVLNLNRPAEGGPMLMPIDEVVTLFHEFGHGLHGLLSDVRYPSLSGTDVATDFVELPSQIHEHWALHPQVLPKYARHHETGEVIPEDVVARLKAARRFGQGYETAELAEAALLDLAWHGRSAHQAPVPAEQVEAFEHDTLVAAGFDPEIVPPRYRTAYFSHIWSDTYSANYGAYIASAVLECDGFAWFEENGGLTRENGEHFRRTVLSRGNSAPPDELYRDFRGRDPNIEPLLADRGLLPEPARRPSPGRR